MLVPLSWLKEFVDIKLPFPELAAKLSEAGLTVETWSAQGRSASGGKEVDSDIIFDPEITPNRPDWMSVFGIAREIAAITGARLKDPTPKLEIKKPKNPLEITVKPDFALVPRKTSVIIRNVKVKPSPEWLQKRIKQVGLRPINNLVDITNYVLWIYGSLLHVFDYDKIRGHQITIELSKGGEDFRSLDGIDYKLPKNAVIIKDVGRVIDLLPLKGGENTAASSETKNVLLHSVICDPVLTRRTSQFLGLRSDSSTIAERGLNPNGTIQALTHALSLILDLAGGEVASEITDLKKEDFEPWTVELSHEKLEQTLGFKIDPKTVLDYFTRLTLKPTINPKQDPTFYSVEIPTYRQDLRIEEDLIEEVARLYGYNQFPKTLPANPVPTAKVAYNRNFDFEYDLKQILTGAGYSEVYTYSLTSESQLTKLAIDPSKTLRVDNPISKEYEYLRPNLIGNLLEAVKLNLPNFSEIQLFELGKIYKGSSIDKFEEQYWLSAVVSADRFFEAKGVTESLLTQLGINYQITPSAKDPIGWSHPGRTADITSGEHHLGAVGELHPSLLSRFGIKNRVVGWYLNYALLEKLANPKRTYHPVPKYPAVVEDISLIIPEKILYFDLIETIELSSKLVSSIQLLDTHENTKTLRITYLDPSKNLTDPEVAQIKSKFLKKLRDLGVKEK